MTNSIKNEGLAQIMQLLATRNVEVRTINKGETLIYVIQDYNTRIEVSKTRILIKGDCIISSMDSKPYSSYNKSEFVSMCLETAEMHFPEIKTIKMSSRKRIQKIISNSQSKYI